jgi:hypothetical protein
MPMPPSIRVGAASAASFSGIANMDQELAAEAAPTKNPAIGTGACERPTGPRGIVAPRPGEID